MINEIEILINEKAKELENAISMWSNELNEITDSSGFDEYSKSWQKKMKKLNEKYAVIIATIESEMKELEEQNAQQVVERPRPMKIDTEV